jgi:peroxiredoxin
MEIFQPFCRHVVAAGFAFMVLAAGSAGAFEVGPKPGSALPLPFAVANEQGEAQDFQSLRGEKGLVLVFHRSAKWCPYCQAQLIDLKTIVEPLKARGYALAALSYDAPQVLAEFQAKHALGYRLVSDQGSRVIDAFALRDPAYKEGTMPYGVPRPAIFIIDANGVIKASIAEEGYKTRPSSAAVLTTIDSLAGKS